MRFGFSTTIPELWPSWQGLRTKIIEEFYGEPKLIQMDGTWNPWLNSGVIAEIY